MIITRHNGESQLRSSATFPRLRAGAAVRVRLRSGEWAEGHTTKAHFLSWLILAEREHPLAVEDVREIVINAEDEI